jgi:transcriptional regulator of arginine metabolism
MSTKVQRQQLIAKIVSSQNVTSQPKLRELLKKKGIKATQATVSRDLEDLGAVKVRTASGETTYAYQSLSPIVFRHLIN